MTPLSEGRLDDGSEKKRPLLNARGGFRCCAWSKCCVSLPGAETRHFHAARARGYDFYCNYDSTVVNVIAEIGCQIGCQFGMVPLKTG